jgi:hypothetical protein
MESLVVVRLLRWLQVARPGHEASTQQGQLLQAGACFRRRWRMLGRYPYTLQGRQAWMGTNMLASMPTWV